MLKHTRSVNCGKMCVRVCVHACVCSYARMVKNVRPIKTSACLPASSVCVWTESQILPNATDWEAKNSWGWTVTWRKAQQIHGKGLHYMLGLVQCGLHVCTTLTIQNMRSLVYLRQKWSTCEQFNCLNCLIYMSLDCRRKPRHPEVLWVGGMTCCPGCQS